MTLGEIINEYRKEHDLSITNFSDVSGLSRAYISKLENDPNATPTLKTVNAVAKGVHTNTRNIVNRLNGENIAHPNEVIVYNEQFTKIDTIVSDTAATCAVKVSCEDMIPEIKPGDLVLVNKKAKIKDRDYVLLKNGTVSRIYIYNNKTVRLQAESPLKEPLIYNSVVDASIYGKIIEVIRNYK